MSAPELAAIGLTSDQRAKERSVAIAIAMDVTMFVSFMTVSVVGGSFTLMAESIRGGLGILLECFSYVVLRRIHRGVLEALDYGSGKLEQVANLVIGASMLFAATWIVVGALRILSGDRGVGTPIGLACAAIAGMVNIYVNLLAWDGMRRAAAQGDSLIMQAQLLLRRTKLFASLIIGIGLTVAAFSTDELIVAWSDALGSLFVAGYMTVNALKVLRTTLPDLLDRSAGIEIRQAVDRGLTRHADAYAQLHRVRSRRAGRTAFVEISLGFDPSLSMAEVDRRVEALKTTLREEIDNVEISILASAAPP